MQSWSLLIQSRINVYELELSPGTVVCLHTGLHAGLHCKGVYIMMSDIDGVRFGLVEGCGPVRMGEGVVVLSMVSNKFQVKQTFTHVCMTFSSNQDKPTHEFVQVSF